MGVDTRKLPLPAPTESSTLQTSGGSATGTDLATDVSRRTDRTSFSIPEDGSPITISTKKRRDHLDKEQQSAIARASQQSQTSLLIEYFEGGKGPNVHSRPSVRVKVTPSAARKIKDSKDHIQITEAGGHRRPSYTRRISLGPKNGDTPLIESADDRSISSYTSAAEESSLVGRRPPIEIEVMHKDQGSDLSGTSVSRGQKYVQQNTSEISSMPPDSMLEGNVEKVTPHRTRSRSLSRDAVMATTNNLRTPARRRSRSLSRERITQKVIEKLGSRPREVSKGKHKRGSKSRSRSVSQEQILENIKSPKRRSSRHHREEELPSGAESSLLTNSQTSAKRKSGDQYSYKSGTSTSSLNNPKLLQTVEDAIRRLILPELTQLKHEQARQKFDRGNRDSLASESSISRGEVTRRVSKHASAPNVGKPKVVLNRDENNPGTVLSGNSVKGRKEHRLGGDLDSHSEHSFDRGVSDETVIRDEEVRLRKKSRDGHRVRDVTAGTLAGGILTAAALKHHDSRSSNGRSERRKRRSKSHSRSASLAESTEEIFHKHDVPPMPMRSEINESELTRDSILSERTSTPNSEHRRAEIREVVRGSPRELLSPASRTPTRTPVALQRELGTHHSNLSRGEFSIHSVHSDQSLLRDYDHRSKDEEAILTSRGVNAEIVAAERAVNRRDGGDEYTYASHARNRGLSPIQSVASYNEESVVPNRESIRQNHSSGSLSSVDRQQQKNSALSIESLSSAASTNFARSKRPKGIHLEDGKDVLEQHNLGDLELSREEGNARDSAMEEWYEQQHEENDRYRDSMGDSSLRYSTIDVKHMTNYTDDSLDAPYLDKVTAAQHIRGVGANPEYIRTPIAVESAVASLHESSVLDIHSTRSGRSKLEERSYLDSPNVDLEEDAEYPQGLRGDSPSDQGSPLKGHSRYQNIQPLSEKSYGGRSAIDSPRQSLALSMDEKEEYVPMGATGLPNAADPMPEIGHGLDSESDINTNPSIIQGPMGGLPLENRDHWPSHPTPPQSKGDLLIQSNEPSAHESLKAAAAGMLSAAASAGAGAAFANREREKNGYERDHKRDLSFNEDRPTNSGVEYERGVNHDFGPIRDSYMSGQTIPTPPMAKDEGYISAANPRSAGAITPDHRAKGAGIFDDDVEGGIDEIMGEYDPFVGQAHARRSSGNSHGMPSPLYDSATGRGIDRIQSKDIVALMDHLTVRDAQRNARDTEILVTLVRSAAEMRNSFEDMKRFIAEQDEMLIDTGSKQHDRSVQKIIGGPRPQPLGTPRIPRRTSAEDDMMDDIPTKRRNVFKRALKGLSMRSSNDLGKIEEMLVQLLGDVEGLKAAQDIRPSTGEARADSFNSYENTRSAAPDGYEPEGQAGTSSTGNQSGYFSNPPSRQASGMRGFDGRRGSQNRVSTVLEGDEELEMHEKTVLDHGFEDNEQLLTPTREHPRGGSVPLDTPPMVHMPAGTQSNEHTPKTTTDKSRKHKSSSSSFFPKISRWSKTTASSVGDNFRSSGRKERPLSEASRSGSDLNYNVEHHYDPQGEDRIRSHDSFEHDQLERPPSPLIPSQVSDAPKWQAHRNSLNLQHPQPRPGPTDRYQTHLESQAQNFGSPISPTSDQWGSNPTLARFAPVPGNRRGGGAGYLSPISDDAYSEHSAAEQSNAPPRPPKILDDGPLVPQPPPKVTAKDHFSGYDSPRGSGLLAPVQEQRYSNGSSGYEQANGSPRAASGQAPQRKPTGPRPIAISGNYSPDKATGVVKQTRYRGSPNHIDSSTEDVTF